MTLEQNEQAAIDAGEETTPALSNKEFFTGTDIFIAGKEYTVFTILRFADDAQSELFQSNIDGDQGMLINNFDDIEGPSLAELIDAVSAHISEISQGEPCYTEEQIRVICEDISANY
tara:strand:- start:737 stop:1087 length:351 start_codon:yes stop_codon:yes gene_type:complete